MTARMIAGGAVVAAAIAAGAWLGRDSAPVQSAAHALGLAVSHPAPTTTETLHAAGVHKCQTPGGILYVDAACPKGSREVQANRGTVSAMPFPKPAPALLPPSLASGALGGPLVKPMDPEERDRLRDKAIEDASNRR